MESVHFYHDYLTKCYNTIEALSKQLHETYIMRNNLANVCYANINCLEANNLSKVVIDDLISGKRVKGTKFVKKLEWGNEAIATLVRISYNRFIYLASCRIPKLIALIRYYDWMCRIPYPIFNQMQRGLNKSLLETLIRGDTVSLGTYLGKYQVQRAIAREGVDWGESYKFRKELIAQGVEVKSIINPYGRNWYIRITKPFYWFCKWMRHISGIDVVPNQIFYKFRPQQGHLGLDDAKLKRFKTVEDVFKADDVAFDSKLRWIVANDKDINERYVPCKVKRERLKDGEVDEYVRPNPN